MMKIIKSHWKFLLFVLICSIVGGIFTGIYTINSSDESIINEAIKQVDSKELIVVITTIQIIIYSAFCSIFGSILSEKTKLWKPFTANKIAIISVVVITIFSGILLIIGDVYIFGSFNEQIKSSYVNKPTIESIIASFTYGGIIEEVMLRLFLMSLLSFVIYKIFLRKKEEKPVYVYIISNVISALAFALLHIPATITLFGELTPLLFIRCIFMNGLFGLAFGWLYRKYGIGYAMLGHFGCHFISMICQIKCNTKNKD